MKRIILLALASILLSGGTGCGLYHTILYAPLGPGTLCDPEHGCCGHGPSCGADCGPPCGPECGPCASSCGPTCGPECGTACDEGCEPACDQPCGSECGQDCGPAYYPGCGPLSLVAWLFGGDYWCGTGCGEIYWGDFHGDPPDCRDPCDRCGNFSGVHVDGCTGGCAEGCVDGYVDGGYSGKPAASAMPVATRTDRLSPARQLTRTRRATLR